MRSVLLFLAGLVLGACGHTQPTPTAPTRVDYAAELAAKTVALVGHDPEGNTRSYCSGVWVSDTSILTAFHCVDDEDSIEYAVRSDIYAPGELAERQTITSRPAHAYALDPEHDLALLRDINAPSHGLARINLADIRQGSFAQAMGHSLGLWWSYSSGDIAAVRQREISGLDIVWIQATTPISPGNSGCGLFDDRGFLIGLAHATFTRGELLNVFVHGQYLDAFLRRSGT